MSSTVLQVWRDYNFSYLFEWRKLGLKICSSLKMLQFENISIKDGKSLYFITLPSVTRFALNRFTTRHAEPSSVGQ